jgi:DNA-directed RNA polymerase beta subunit
MGTTDLGVTALTAETSTSNEPSQRVLARNGFVQVGERVDDEDGQLICGSTLPRRTKSRRHDVRVAAAALHLIHPEADRRKIIILRSFAIYESTT